MSGAIWATCAALLAVFVLAALPPAAFLYLLAVAALVTIAALAVVAHRFRAERDVARAEAERVERECEGLHGLLTELQIGAGDALPLPRLRSVPTQRRSPGAAEWDRIKRATEGDA